MKVLVERFIPVKVIDGIPEVKKFYFVWPIPHEMTEEHALGLQSDLNTLNVGGDSPWMLRKCYKTGDYWLKHGYGDDCVSETIMLTPKRYRRRDIIIIEDMLLDPTDPKNSERIWDIDYTRYCDIQNPRPYC